MTIFPTEIFSQSLLDWASDSSYIHCILIRGFSEFVTPSKNVESEVDLPHFFKGWYQNADSNLDCTERPKAMRKTIFRGGCYAMNSEQYIIVTNSSGISLNKPLYLVGNT